MPIKGSLRFVSAVVLCAMVFQSVFMFAPQRTWAIDVSPQSSSSSPVAHVAAPVYRTAPVPVEDYDPNRDYTIKVGSASNSASCENSLLKRSIPEILSYVFAFGPIRKTLGDYNRFRFVVLRAPLYGLINTPLSVTLSMTLAWAVSHAMGGTGAFPDLIGAAALGSFLESWGSYNLSNIPRDAVTLDKTLPDQQRYWLNIWYSAVAYIALTAGPVLAKAHNSAGYNHAMALITFALIWPFFSRWAGMKITKYLFEGFPKDDELKIFKLSEDHRQELLATIRREINELEVELTNLGAVELAGQTPRQVARHNKRIDKLKKKLTNRKDALKFASQSREDFLTAKRKTVEVSAAELATTERLLQQAEDFYRRTKAQIHKSNVKYFKSRITQIKDVKRSSEKVIGRLEVMRKNIDVNQDIPFQNRVAMFMNSLGWSTAGAVVMTVIYFLSRWALVGQSQNDTGASHPLKHLFERGREYLGGTPSTAEINPSFLGGTVQMASEAINTAQQTQTEVTALENKDVSAMTEVVDNLRREVNGESAAPLTPATVEQIDDMATGFDVFLERTLEPAAAI